MFNTHNIIYEKNSNLEDIYRLREHVMMFKNNPFVENKLDTTTYDTLIKACKEREHYISLIEKSSGWDFSIIDLRYRYLGLINSFVYRTDFSYNKKDHRIDWKLYQLRMLFWEDGKLEESKEPELNRFLKEYFHELNRIEYLNTFINHSIEQSEKMTRKEYKNQSDFCSTSYLKIPSIDEAMEKKLNERAELYIEKYPNKGMVYLVDIFNQLSRMEELENVNAKIAKYDEIRNQITDPVLEEEILFWISIYVNGGDKILQTYSKNQTPNEYKKKAW